MNENEETKSEEIKVDETDYGHKVNLEESSAETRKNKSTKKKDEEKSGIVFKVCATCSIVTKTATRGTVKSLASAIDNSDSILEILSYLLIAWGYELYQSNQNHGSILIGVGCFIAIMKNRIPQGSWSKFLRLPSEEIKKKVKERYVDISKSLRG